jgi:pimeloyl-ACP methyl ester carboxylesterase
VGVTPHTIGSVSGLFVPGWGAVPGLYRRGLPLGWEALQLPPYRRTGRELSGYREWLSEQIARREGPISLAGHSMGAALAILVAADRPAAIERLILLSPAGLPLSKPMTRSLFTFSGQVIRGSYPAVELSRAMSGVLRSPRTAFAVARAVHDLDLSSQLERLSRASVPVTVVGSSTDQLTTPKHCQRLAALLGASYHELDVPGGHIWMIVEPTLLSAALRKKGDPSRPISTGPRDLGCAIEHRTSIR